MKSVRYIGCVVLFACLSFLLFPVYIQGQNVCVNRTLQRIVEDIPDLSVESVPYSELTLSQIHKNRPIVITRNTEGEISHIGFKLFNRKVMEKHPSFLYNFVERYLLNLYLLSDEQARITRLKMDKVRISSEVHPFTVSIKQGLQRIMAEDTSQSSIYITCNGNRYVVSCFVDDKQLIAVSFPVRHELITGFSKVEAESSFLAELYSFEEMSQPPLSDLDMSAYKDTLFLSNDDFYATESIVSTAYYQKSGEHFIPLFTPDYPIESVYNLFNAYSKPDFMAELSQSLYGSELRTMEIPLRKLVSYLREQGCRIYTGITETDEVLLKGMVIAINSELGYQHLLSFSVDKTLLFSMERPKVKIKIYCYIPAHNISALLGN